MPTRQTLRDFLASAGSSASVISLPVDPGSDGIVAEGDDLGREPNTRIPLLDFPSGKSLLGDYASFITKENDYPLSPGVHESPGSNRGSALEVAEASSAKEVFVKSNDRDNAAGLNRSNSQIFDKSGYRLNDLIDKTGDGTAPTGNDLLQGVVSSTSNADTVLDQSPAVVASFASFRKYNKFSPASNPDSFARDDAGETISSTEYSDSRKLNFQVGEGVYEPKVVEVSAEVDQETLAKVARSAILKAAGWDESILPIDAVNPDKAFKDISSSTLGRFPSILRNNQKIADPFRAQDSYNMPQAADGSSKLGNRGDAIQKSIEEAVYMHTRGSTHTPDQTFGENPDKKASEKIQSLQAAIAMVGLAAIIEKRLIDYESYVSDLQVTTDRVLRGPYYMGDSIRSRVTAKTRALVRSFMFQTGIYSYSACMSEGFYACLGFESFSRTGAPRSIPVEIDTDVIVSVSEYKSYIEKITNNFGKEFYKSPMGLSQGFWRAVSESAIRAAKNLKESAASLDGVDFASCILGMKDSLVFKIMNVFASIGYQRLVIQGGIATADVEQRGAQIENPYDMNAYPTTAGTRQMKSRDGALLSNASLAWRNSALPSAFILPVEAMSLSLDMDYMFDQEKGSNPIKGMLGSTLHDKTYVKAVRNSNYIPSIVTKFVEDRLGAEYLPFYFRDLRTNEIVAFHGFLESLTDGFTANYSDTKGFGRADSVQNYSNTVRNINFTFWLVATSKEDFDEMWFKINKLTTLLYPQYTRGRPVSQKDESTILGSWAKQTVNFEQPFSQLAGGTPVTRIRVGDLIKTNYTRSNFAKLFGVGNDTFNANADKGLAAIATAATGGGWGSDVANFDLRLVPFLLYAASPMELASLSNTLASGGAAGAARAGADTILEFLSYTLKNGFVNPVLASDRERFFKNILGTGNNRDFSDEGFGDFLTNIGISSKVMLKARGTPYLITEKDNQMQLRLRRPVFVKVNSAREDRTGTVYNVTLNDTTIGSDLNGKKFDVSAADLVVDAGQIVDIGSLPGVLLSAGLITGLAGVVANSAANGANTGLANNTSFDAPVDIPLGDLFGSLGRTFTSPYNNPITRAFEDRMGEGLAGVVKSMSFTWMDSPWEVDWNSRAPTACKITIGFSPIHDISPGLDSNGFNRAPIYNVGQIMNDTFGQPRSDGGAASRYFFKKTGSTAENARSPDEYNLKV